MLIKAKILEHYNSCNFKIPLTGSERIYVKNQQKVPSGETLFTKTDNRIKQSYFLVDELGCKSSECLRHISCINGSYVRKGEVLAQKAMKKGLTVKQIVAGVSGIVDLERIRKGFIDILAEEEEVTVKSNFKGTVANVLPGDHININSPASVLDLSATTLFDEKMFGSMVFLGKEGGFVSDIPDIDLKNKIVWAGSYLPLTLALKVFKKGARAIVTYCMEYRDFKDLGLPIGIIEGFGKIHCDDLFLKELYKFEDKFVVLDGQEKQLFAAKEQQKQQGDREFFVKELLGAQVISRHSAHYGYIGSIVQINDLNYVTVDFDKSGKSIVDLGSLDFIAL